MFVYILDGVFLIIYLYISRTMKVLTNGTVYLNRYYQRIWRIFFTWFLGRIQTILSVSCLHSNSCYIHLYLFVVNNCLLGNISEEIYVANICLLTLQFNWFQRKMRNGWRRGKKRQDGLLHPPIKLRT